VNEPRHAGGDVQDSDSLGRRFIRGAAWMLAAKLAERALGLVSTLLLARLLFPEDFGLVAMAAPVIALVELMGALGVDAALIQRKKITRAHLDTAFTLQLIVASLVATTLWCIAPLAAEFFREPRLTAVIYWLALGQCIQGFANPSFILFRKEVNMKPEVLLMLATKLTSLFVAVSAAIILRNHWALIAGMLTSKMLNVGLSYAMSPYRPSLSLSERRDILGFSYWMLAIQILNYLQLRTNDLIIGRLLGPTQLAFFSISVDLAATAPGEASMAISRASFPTMSKMTDDPERLRFALRNILAGVALFALPVAFAIAALADFLVIVLLGERWIVAATIIPALALSAAILGIMGQIPYAYMALGKPRLAAFISAMAVVVLVLVSLWAIPVYGLQGVRIAYPAMAISVVIGHTATLRFVMPGFTLGDWFRALWRPLVASLVMYVLASGSATVIGQPTGSLAGLPPLLGLAAIACASYVAAVAVLWWLSGRPEGPEALIWSRLKGLRRTGNAA